VIRALKNTGEFMSLAKPNLVTREGQEASFLAGGEFPFPSVQGGQQAQAVTIQWREFGIRLNFTPTLTVAGNIRLRVAPEVSSLDFANGLTFQGYQIPAILSRKWIRTWSSGRDRPWPSGGSWTTTFSTPWTRSPSWGTSPSWASSSAPRGPGRTGRSSWSW
jgi:hypothetical protein